jgi:hypothetical protein
MTNERTNDTAAPSRGPVAVVELAAEYRGAIEPTPYVPADIDPDTAPTAEHWDDYRGPATYTRIGNPATNGRPMSWATVAPDPTERPSHDARVTRSRKSGTSFRVGRGAAWLRTTGAADAADARDAVTYIPDESGDLVPFDLGSADDAAYAVVREARLVAAADAWLASSAELDLVTPTGRVLAWADTAGRSARLGGYALTDRPASRSAHARAMRPMVIGGRGDRGISGDATSDPDDYCHTHRGAVSACGCVLPRRATVGACAVNRDESDLDRDSVGTAWHGFTGATTLRDAWRVRQSVGAPSRSRAYDACDVLSPDDAPRKVRGIRVPDGAVTYNRDDMTATIGDRIDLLAWAERSTAATVDTATVAVPLDLYGRTDETRPATVAVWSPATTERFPMLGHARLTVDGRTEPTTRAGRAVARAAGRNLIARRRALAVELTAILASLTVGDMRGATITDDESVIVTRPAANRYAVNGSVVDMGGHAATPAAVAVKLARRLTA